MKISGAYVLSIIAIVLACAGGAVAATAITGAQIKNSSITGLGIKNRSLSPVDFRGSVRGLQGPVGPQGPAGPAALSAIIRVASPTITLAPGQVTGTTATCPPGYGVVTGGYITASADGEAFASDSFGSANSWSVNFDNFDSPVEATLTAVAYCVASGGAASPRASEGVAPQERVAASIRAQRSGHPG